MKTIKSIVGAGSVRLGVAFPLLALALALGTITGCIGSKAKKNDKEFFTSGSREADQRASQRMAKAEQLAGSGEGAGERETKGGGGSGPPKAQAKQTLFERLGGEQGISAIVDDFIARAMQDPRVNWQRKGVTRARLFHHNQAMTWTPTEQGIGTLKQHMVQFIALATGGPAQYEGKGMKEAHGNMHISNPEFDAAVGDLKAALGQGSGSKQGTKRAAGHCREHAPADCHGEVGAVFRHPACCEPRMSRSPAKECRGPAKPRQGPLTGFPRVRPGSLLYHRTPNIEL